MSLTSILKCPTHQDLRNKLKDESPKPKVRSGLKINVRAILRPLNSRKLETLQHL